jgi:hypothetical protein
VSEEEIVPRQKAPPQAVGEWPRPAEYEKGVRELQKDFPKDRNLADALRLANRRAGKAKQLPRRSTTVRTRRLKEAAKVLRNWMPANRSICNLRRSMAGSEHEEASGQSCSGDFCYLVRPLRAQVPLITYEKLHPKGFEIVGIS